MSTDRLDVLRERNKRLLKQLQQQRENLEQFSGCSESRKREREDEDGERRQAEVTVTRTDGDRGPARAALAKPSVRFADTLEIHEDNQNTIFAPSETSKSRGGPPKRRTPVHQHRDRNVRVPNRLQDTRDPLRSSQVGHNKDQEEIQSQVTFHSDEDEDAAAASFSHRLQPLLGYDWIAGVLDTKDSLVERSDEFFSDLRIFRSLYKDECIHDSKAELFEDNHLFPPVLTDKDDQEANPETHQCTFSYRINSRLFPVPLHSQECCPVCKKHKSSHPHTAAEPAHIRVSIPRTALLPCYKYKAHRRCSFDPSDSLGLPSHCLSGWSNTGQNTLKPPSSLDLRSSLKTRSAESSPNTELEDLSASRRDGNVKMADVSRLARHNFQHFLPRRKPRTQTYLKY
uniref:Migration and invasion inhibitory protein n=2 Tax=Iconisemion striatum TaxID=60296 RepID=A0A1A7WMR8_9TELE